MSGTSLKATDGTFRREHDHAGEGLPEAIAEGVAEVTDASVAEVLDEFTDHANPVAVDAVFEPPPGDVDGDGARLHLCIKGVDVTVSADGEIRFEQ